MGKMLFTVTLALLFTAVLGQTRKYTNWYIFHRFNSSVVEVTIACTKRISFAYMGWSQLEMRPVMHEVRLQVLSAWQNCVVIARNG